MSTLTKGNIVIEDIKIGDIHYEYDMGMVVKVEVTSLPVKSDEGKFTWESKNVLTGKEVHYLLTPGFEHYGPNLYDYEAYKGCKQI